MLAGGNSLQKLVNRARGQRSLAGLQQWANGIELAIAVGVVFYLAAQLGLSLLTTAERVAVFWPASGVAAGTLIAFGSRARTPVATGVIAASLVANIMADRSLLASLAFGLCNASEALIVAWLIERSFGPAFNLDSLRRVVGFFAAAVVGTATAAAAGSTAMKLFGPATAELLDIWKVWFPAGALGVITVAPLLIGVAAAGRDRPSWRELVEGTLAVIVVAVTIGIALALLTGSWSLIGPSPFLFPLLLWLGSRCRPVFAAAAAFTIAVAIVWTTTHEFGRYGDPGQPIADRVLAAQIAMLGTTLAALALAALFAERRRQEVAAGESDTRLRSILDSANVIAWDVDLVRNTVHSAGPVGRLLDRSEGSEPRDFAAFVDSIHPDDRDRVMAQFWTAVRAGGGYQLEFRLNLPGGERWVTAEGTIEHDSHDRPVRVRGITHDITERKKAELALAERDAQLALAGKVARVGSYAWNIKSGRVQISPGYAAIHGFAEGTNEIALEEWRTGVHPDDLRRLDERRDETFAERRVEHNAEYRVLRADGRVRWTESRALVSYNGDGHAERMVGVNIDVTDRKQSEEHQGLLIAELDHRVKNVLASVAVVARRTSEHNSSTVDFINALERRIQSMADTHDLLSRNRWQKISCADLVRRELAPYATADNVEVDGPYVGLPAASAQAMAMVLHELATNAAKYGALSTPQGRVSVRWHRPSNGNVSTMVRLEWREDGGPPVTAPARPGYGTSVIRDLIPYEIGGTVELEFRTDGVCCTMEIAVGSDTDRVAISRTNVAALQ